MTPRFGKKKPPQQASRFNGQTWLTRLSDARSAELANALRRIAPPSDTRVD